jgi:hypothetical protein
MLKKLYKASYGSFHKYTNTDNTLSMEIGKFADENDDDRVKRLLFGIL